jgi:hypothetical protein
MVQSLFIAVGAVEHLITTETCFLERNLRQPLNYGSNGQTVRRDPLLIEGKHTKSQKVSCSLPRRHKTKLETRDFLFHFRSASRAVFEFYSLNRHFASQ